MKIITLVSMVCVCGLATSSEAAQSGKYAGMGLPDNVTLGMTRDALQSIRSDAKKLDMAVSRNTNAVVLTEIKGDVMPLIFYQYYFINDHLRAITKGIGYVGAKDEQSVVRIHDAIAKNFVKRADEKILRLTTELEEVPVELWNDAENSVHVYFVDTSNETSVTIFEPKYFQKKDFFITPDEKAQVAPAVEGVRKTLEESNNLKK